MTTTAVTATMYDGSLIELNAHQAQRAEFAHSGSSIVLDWYGPGYIDDNPLKATVCRECNKTFVYHYVADQQQHLAGHGIAVALLP
jgi:hypothetical protein